MAVEDCMETRCFNIHILGLLLTYLVESINYVVRDIC
jgi:hypothetical protein